MATYRKTRRVIAAAGALALSGLMLTATTASATPVDGPVDATKTGSLTIHKFEYPADGYQNPSGTGLDPTGPIENVVFRVCQVTNVTSLGDTSNAGWAQVKGLNANSSAADGPLTGTVAGVDASTSFPLSGCQDVTTNASGATPTLTSLAVGAYLVTEKSAPAGVIKGSPFIVTVPTPADGAGGQANTGSWEYDVNVYPKNMKATTPVKTIGDQPDNGVVLGQDIDFTISQVIPALNEMYSKFVVTDALDTKLDYKAGTVVVKYDGTTLVEGTDYTLDTTGDVIVVKLLPTAVNAGGVPYIPIEGGKTLTVEFTATANATGEIANQAIVNINDLDFDGDGTPGTPTNEVKTRWGNLLGEKINADDTMKLGGAQFEVYMTTDTDGTCAAATTADLTGLTSVTSVTSAANGSIAIPGLWVGDTNDNVTNRCYILKEIVAPAGYVLPTGDAALHSVNITVGTVTTATFDVKNDQQLVPFLPLTGADGQRMLLIAGGALLLLAIGGALLRIGRRREETITA